MATRENEAKKQFLRRYNYLRRKEEELEAEMDAIRAKYTGRAITYSDMPTAHDSEHDLSDYAAEVDDLLCDLIAIRNRAIASYRHISKSIEAMSDDREKELLRLKYLHGLDWEEVADRMHYTTRWVYKLHGYALAHFRIIPPA